MAGARPRPPPGGMSASLYRRHLIRGTMLRPSMPSTLPALTTRAVRRKTGAPRRRPFSASLLLGISIIFATVFTLRAQSPRPNTTAPQVIDYARDIKPIFEKNCYECHGPTKARGRLRLHAGEFILKGGASRACRRGRAQRPESVDTSGPGAGRRRPDAARPRSPARHSCRTAQGLDRSGCAVSARRLRTGRRRGSDPGTLGLREAEAAGASVSEEPCVGAQRHRPIRSRASSNTRISSLRPQPANQRCCAA